LYLAKMARLSQKVLAAASGVNEKTISAWKSGRKPSARSMAKVLKVLRCTPEDIEEVAAYHRQWRERLRQTNELGSSIEEITGAGRPYREDIARDIGHHFMQLMGLLSRAPTKH